jgi:hypothetical protein
MEMVRLTFFCVLYFSCTISSCAMSSSLESYSVDWTRRIPLAVLKSTVSLPHWLLAGDSFATRTPTLPRFLILQPPICCGALAYMATSTDAKGQYHYSPPRSSKYGDAAYCNPFSPSNVSKEAQDDVKANRLWELSEKLLGINTA